MAKKIKTRILFNGDTNGTLSLTQSESERFYDEFPNNRYSFIRLPMDNGMVYWINKDNIDLVVDEAVTPPTEGGEDAS